MIAESIRKKLSPKQQRFIDEYLVDLNATQAAIRAGYSPRTANEQAARLLAKASVAGAIAERMAQRERRTKVTQDSVIRELARIAFADPRRVMEWGPNGVKLTRSSELNDDDAAAIAEVSETRTEHGGSMRVKLVSKERALELLGRHLAMFTDKIQHTDELRSLTDEEVDQLIFEKIRALVVSDPRYRAVLESTLGASGDSKERDP